jgi:molecular chaperone DnaK (HSP70)
MDKLLMMDVNPLTLGIETSGGVMVRFELRGERVFWPGANQRIGTTHPA